ncbi:MAG TPA: hypothetical protein VE932_09235 [Patescibacteria group bacterium]|nr:hypothetical protein [Patescibacteria group bacterium]
MPGPPSGNENYVITISVPGPLSREAITKLNAKIRACLKELGADAVCSEQKIVPKKC